MILAIDDDPGRYSYLQILLDERRAIRGLQHKPPPLKIVTCTDCVENALKFEDYNPWVTAILLDYDLDGADLCSGCGNYNGELKSTAHLDKIIQAHVPVIITSCSGFANRKYLFDKLTEAKVQVASIPADHSGVEREWLGTLWSWGLI